MSSAGVAAQLPNDFDQELAATVSRLFWLEDKSKSEIAEGLNLSRFKVARILDDARKYGIARIEIVEPTRQIERVATQLQDAFGLREVRLSSVPVGSPGGLAALGAVAAAYVGEIVRPGSVLGLGWGATLGEVVAHLAPGGPADVVQLAGGFASSDVDFNGNQLITAASGMLGGTPYMLHAPALVASSAARALLRNDETIGRTIERYAHLDAIVTGVGVLASESGSGSSTAGASTPGSSTPGSSITGSAIYRGGVLGRSVHDDLREWGVVGDTCCHFVDENGTVIAALSERVTGISVDEIRATPLRVAVAGGADKERPIRAALRSGLPNVLVTDVDTARRLLAPA